MGATEVARTSSPRQRLGREGEALAARWLEERGWRVLDRNWHCRHGELDLVMTDPGGRLVFVEVKTRRSRRYGHPVEVLDARKISRLRVLAWLWVYAHPNAVHFRRPIAFRIDLVGVLLERGDEPEVSHLEAVA